MSFSPPVQSAPNSPKISSIARKKATGKIYLTNGDYIKAGETAWLVKSPNDEYWFKSKQSAERWYKEIG